MLEAIVYELLHDMQIFEFGKTPKNKDEVGGPNANPVTC